MLKNDPILFDLWAYWHAKRDGRKMPRRKDIDPTEIPPLLPHILLIETDEQKRFRYRLVGTAIVETYGQELTGRFVDELFTPPRRAVAVRHYTVAFESMRPFAVRNRYTNVRGTELLATRVILPLSEDGVAVNMLLMGQTCTYAAPVVQGLGRDTVIDAADDQLQFLDAGDLRPAG